MKDISRPISLSLFVLILLCFLLPFARITCNKTEVVQATGYEVAFGKTIAAQPDTTGGRPSWKERPATADFLGIVCLVAAIVGVGLALLRGRKGAIARAILSGHGLILMLALWGELRYRVHENSAALTLLGGYWISLLLFAAAGAVNVFAVRRGRAEDRPSSGTQ